MIPVLDAMCTWGEDYLDSLSVTPLLRLGQGLSGTAPLWNDGSPGGFTRREEMGIIRGNLPERRDFTMDYAAWKVAWGSP